jgi:FtsH-binding integral membrane protein
MYKQYDMKNYIKRLNWSGFVFVFVLTGAASFSREQDPSLLVSFYAWMILGLPISSLVLFIGIKPKNI